MFWFLHKFHSSAIGHIYGIAAFLAMMSISFVMPVNIPTLAISILYALQFNNIYIPVKVRVDASELLFCTELASQVNSVGSATKQSCLKRLMDARVEEKGRRGKR